MNRDDYIYAILLLLGISFGHFYRKILDVNVKQVTGTALGLALVLFTSQAHSFHVFFSFLVSCLLIKHYKSWVLFQHMNYFVFVSCWFDFRKCHLIVFCFMMTYLLFFRTLHLFGLPIPSGHTNMIYMIMVLKVIGLAFETNSVYTKSRDDDKTNSLTAAEREIQSMSLINMFHYCFTYIGLLTGELNLNISPAKYLKLALFQVHTILIKLTTTFFTCRLLRTPIAGKQHLISLSGFHSMAVSSLEHPTYGHSSMP